MLIVKRILIISIVINKIIIIKKSLLLLFIFIIIVYEGNEEEWLHEGDIRLSYKQEIALEMFGDPTAPVLGARGITKYQNLLWNTRVVPYNISSELGELNNEREKRKLLGVFAACFDTCARKTLITIIYYFTIRILL